MNEWMELEILPVGKSLDEVTSKVIAAQSVMPMEIETELCRSSGGHPLVSSVTIVPSNLFLSLVSKPDNFLSLSSSN